MMVPAILPNFGAINLSPHQISVVLNLRKAQKYESHAFVLEYLKSATQFHSDSNSEWTKATDDIGILAQIDVSALESHIEAPL